MGKKKDFFPTLPIPSPPHDSGPPFGMKRSLRKIVSSLNARHASSEEGAPLARAMKALRDIEIPFSFFPPLELYRALLTMRLRMASFETNGSLPPPIQERDSFFGVSAFTRILMIISLDDSENFPTSSLV